MYIADYSNNRIRKVTVATSIISTIAGTGASGLSGNNGQATSATVYIPCGVALDSSGGTFICFPVFSSSYYTIFVRQRVHS